MDRVTEAVETVFREEWGRLMATLIRTTGDWDLAEECAQDAFARALDRWPAEGVPDRPGAWLVTTARNRAMDLLRRKANEARRQLLEQGQYVVASGGRIWYVVDPDTKTIWIKHAGTGHPKGTDR